MPKFAQISPKSNQICPNLNILPKKYFDKGFGCILSVYGFGSNGSVTRKEVNFA